MTMTSAAYDAIIAEILGGYEKPEVSEEKPKGLGAMTSRAGMKMPEVSDETEVPSSQAAVNKFMTAIASQRGSKAPAFVEKAYDPLTFTSEHMQRAGMKVMDALAMALEDPQEGKIKVPVGEDFKEDYFTNAENILNQMKSAAQGSSLDIRAANLTRGMTSKQTDTQPTVSSDSSRDRFEIQGDMRDLPVLDDEGAPEVDTRSNELLDKELPIAGLGSRPMEGMSAQAEGFFNKSVSEAFNIVNDKVGMTKDEWSAFKKEVAKIESGGKKDPYRIKGGANDHYDGKYQMGKLAKLDAADLLGMDIGHSKEDRESFRNTPSLQEKAFAAFTAKNHNTLMKKSDIYKNLSKKQQTAVLGYAHNQGATAASKWLASGKVGSDKFKTKGTKYSDAIASTLGVTLPSFGSSAPLTSLRPKARPDTRVASN